MNISTNHSTPNWHLVILALILLVGGVLRFSHADWDGGYQLHPDERAILFVASQMHLPDDLGTLLDPVKSSLNPFRTANGEVRQYSYGHLPLYAEIIVERFFAIPCNLVPNACQTISPDSFIGRLFNLSKVSDYIHLTYVGRVFSACYDTVTIGVTYLLGRRLFSSIVGLLASALCSVAVLAIQNAHFGTVDTALALFSTLTVWFLIRYADTQAARESLFAGICWGCAIGSKVTGLLLIVPLLVAHLTFRDQSRFPLLTRWQVFWLTILTAATAFAITNPFAILDTAPFFTSIISQAQMASGAADWPFTRQYGGTLPLIYPIVQQALWSFGLPLTLAAYGGLICFTLEAIRWRARSLTIVVIWIWTITLTAGVQYVKFPRYFLPAAPALFVCAAGFLLNRWGLPQSLNWLRSVLVSMVLIPTVLYAIAFYDMYHSPHPWVAASDWVYQAGPRDTVIVSERWDDALPLDTSRRLREDWVQSNLVDPFAEPDDAEKIENIASAVAHSDLIILSSSRLYGVILRLPERYPLTSAYYRDLFSGKLGFILDRTFARYPTIFGVSLIDNPLLKPRLPDPGIKWPHPSVSFGTADESFTVYDHPLVLVFRNVSHLSTAEIEAAILTESERDSR